MIGLCELWTSQVVFIAKNQRNQTQDRLTDLRWLYSFGHYNTTLRIDPNGGNNRIPGRCEKTFQLITIISYSTLRAIGKCASNLKRPPKVCSDPLCLSSLSHTLNSLFLGYIGSS